MKLFGGFHGNRTRSGKKPVPPETEEKTPFIVEKAVPREEKRPEAKVDPGSDRICADGVEIRPAGTDFYGEARERLLEDVIEADVQNVRNATSKANLIRLAEQEEKLSLTFRKEKNGTAKPYSLQTIKTRESDHHHVVIGVKQE